MIASALAELQCPLLPTIMLDAAARGKSPGDVRKLAAPNDLNSVGMSEEIEDEGPVAAIYHRSLPHVYGYLLSRCGDASLAEDLAAETFMAAVAAAGQPDPPPMTTGWLVGVARHKLADHWRHRAREERGQAAVARRQDVVDDPWDEWLDTEAAYAALRYLPAPQRAALTLRYLDGLPVAEVAMHLDRSVHATETLLVRSRAALRRVYQEGRHGR
jgi:RNA polymerase sigma-70 factor, ECF subfamily